jgi:hypothetical protein
LGDPLEKCLPGLSAARYNRGQHETLRLPIQSRTNNRMHRSRDPV